MKIGMTLTLDGLVRALRWQGLAMAETKTALNRHDDLGQDGKPAIATNAPVKTLGSGNGL